MASHCGYMNDFCQNGTIIEHLTEALKDENFQKLFANFVNQDGALEDGRQCEEQFSVAFRKQCGIVAKFVQPEPGHAIEFRQEHPSQLCFVNICTSESVNQPQCIRKVSEVKEVCWIIPHCLALPRYLKDHESELSGGEYVVYDAVIHPTTYYFGKSNASFAKLIEENILKSLKAKFQVDLSTSEATYLDVMYKGSKHPIPLIVEEKCNADDLIEDCKQLKIGNYEDVPFLSTETNVVNAPVMGANSDVSVYSNPVDSLPGVKDVNKIIAKKVPIVPKYTLKYGVRSDADTSLSDWEMKTPACDLIIKVEMPLIKSSKDLSMILARNALMLKSNSNTQVAYELNLSLPKEVKLNAVVDFDVSASTLKVVLPLMAPETVQNCDRECIEILSDENFMRTEVANVENHECILGLLSLLETNYEFPCFTSRQTKDKVVFVLDVVNAREDSIQVLQCICGCSFQVVFSGGSDVGHFYSFCSKFNFCCSDVNISVSQDNVVLHFIKDSQIDMVQSDHFWVGADQKQLVKNDFLTEDTVLKNILLMQEETKGFLDSSEPLDGSSVNVLKVSPENITFEIKIADGKEKPNLQSDVKACDNSYDSDNSKRNNQGPKNSPPDSNEKDNQNHPKNHDRSRTEGCDNGKSENFTMCQLEIDSSEEQSIQVLSAPLKRGILKYPQGWRTVSESSDDFSWSSCDMTSPDGELPLPFCVDLGNDKPKKSVRFNDHVMKSIFRINSSILGQRKKNQRRANNKRKAAAKKAASAERNGEANSGESSSDELEPRNNLFLESENTNQEVEECYYIKNQMCDNIPYNDSDTTSDEKRIDHSDDHADVHVNKKKHGRRNRNRHAGRGYRTNNDNNLTNGYHGNEKHESILKYNCSENNKPKSQNNHGPRSHKSMHPCDNHKNNSCSPSFESKTNICE